MAESKQGSLTKTLGVTCTAEEKDAVELVARIDRIESGVSGLLRVMSLNQALQRYEEIMAGVPPLRIPEVVGAGTD